MRSEVYSKEESWYSLVPHKAPSYLADDLHWTDEAESRHWLRSGSCLCLIVPRTRLSK